MQTRMIEVDPRELLLLEVNARYLRHEVFQRLVTNIREDDAVTSVPFAAPAGTGESLTGSDSSRLGRFEVLSGNHRVQAAIEAGVALIWVMVTDDDVPRSRRIAIQLSHNALVGEDDPVTLAELYQAIEDVDLRMYSGLDDKILDLLVDAPLESLSEAALDWTTVSLVFLPEELERAQRVLTDARRLVAADQYWLARFADYDRLMESLIEASASADVRNQATAMMLLIEVVDRHRAELASWDVIAVEKHKPGRAWIPLSVILGRGDVPQKAAVTIRRAVDRMVAAGTVEPGELWHALDLWAAQYLATPDKASVPA